jgi:hypothetical protein
MKTMKRFSVLLTALILAAMVPSLSRAQEYPRRDSTMVFTPSNPNLIQKTSYEPFHNAWGFDIMLSNNGFGAGGFYRHEFTDVLSGFAQLAISDVKDEGEVEYVDIYGQSITPHKINRLLLIPVTFGIQYRLFKDDIVDNFRPYVSAGVGPSMIFVSPYSNPTEGYDAYGNPGIVYNQIDFFSSLKKGQFKYTLGGYVGGGAYFGMDKGTLTGVSFRYYFVPYQPGIVSLDNAPPIKRFGGFFITLNFGSLY